MTEDGVFLLLGPEKGEKETYIKKIITSLTKRLGAGPEKFTFYAFEKSINDLVGFLQNGSLFSNHKIILFHGVESIKNKTDVKKIVEYVNHPAEGSTLVLLTEKNSINKTIESNIREKNKKIFWELFNNKKIQWIHDFFRKKELSITQNAIEMLLELVENNTYDLSIECSRLSQFFQESGKITEKNIEDYIFHSKEENVFTLFASIAEQDFANALEILHKLLSSGENQPVQLMIGLLWQFRNLIRIKELLHDNYSFEEACKKVNIRSKRNKAMYHNANKYFSLNEVKAVIKRIMEFDYIIRTSRTEQQKHFLQLFLYTCIIKKGHQLIEDFQHM